MTSPAIGREWQAQADARDYLADVRMEVHEYLDSHDSVVTAQAAEELIARWEASDPDLLIGWLRARGRQVLRDYIYTVTLSQGAVNRRQAQQGRFAAYSGGIENALQSGGQPAAAEFYRYHSVTQGPLLVRKPLGDLTAKQVEEVRVRYNQAALDNAFLAKVLEAVGRKVAAAGPDAVVSDVYSPEQLEQMFSRRQQTSNSNRKQK